MNPYNNRKYPRRGEIYYIKKLESRTTGSEIWSNRHAVIVSSNHMNKHSQVVQVVYITTQEKSSKPNHVDITTGKVNRTVLCEQVTPVDKSRIVEYKGYLSVEQMTAVDKAIAWTLGLLKSVNRKRQPSAT